MFKKLIVYLLSNSVRLWRDKYILSSHIVITIKRFFNLHNKRCFNSAKNKKYTFIGILFDKLLNKLSIKNLLILRISGILTYHARRYAVNLLSLDLNIFKDFIFSGLLGSTVYKFLHSLCETFWDIYLKQCYPIGMLGNVSLSDVLKFFTNKEFRHSVLKILATNGIESNVLFLNAPQNTEVPTENIVSTSGSGSGPHNAQSSASVSAPQNDQTSDNSMSIELRRERIIQ